MGEVFKRRCGCGRICGEPAKPAPRYVDASEVGDGDRVRFRVVDLHEGVASSVGEELWFRANKSWFPARFATDIEILDRAEGGK